MTECWNGVNYLWKISQHSLSKILKNKKIIPPADKAVETTSATVSNIDLDQFDLPMRKVLIILVLAGSRAYTSPVSKSGEKRPAAFSSNQDIAAANAASAAATADHQFTYQLKQFEPTRSPSELQWQQLPSEPLFSTLKCADQIYVETRWRKDSKRQRDKVYAERLSWAAENKRSPPPPPEERPVRELRKGETWAGLKAKMIARNNERQRRWRRNVRNEREADAMRFVAGPSSAAEHQVIDFSSGTRSRDWKHDQITSSSSDRHMVIEPIPSEQRSHATTNLRLFGQTIEVKRPRV